MPQPESPAVALLDRLNASLVFRVVLALFAVTIIAVVVLVAVYFYQFHGSLSDTQATWGEFGDFIGGTVNPVVGMFALFALFLTLVLQAKELEATREELRRSAAASELNTRLSVITALLSHADSWHSLTGKVPTMQLEDYKYWVDKRRPQLARELDELYKSVHKPGGA